MNIVSSRSAVTRALARPPGRRRTKIVCTLGPASADAQVLMRMIRAGMDVARLNFSHGSHDDHSKMLKTLRESAKAVGRPVGVLQDLCGPKIRVGEVPNGAVTLERGQKVRFYCRTPEDKGALPAGEHILPVQYDDLAKDVAVGDRLLFDDGRLEARVEKKGADWVDAVFPKGGVLKSRKGLNLPGVKVSAPSVTEKDLADLEWGLANGVDFVALSFVRTARDLDAVRARVAKHKDPPLLVAKIEKPEAVAALDGIVGAVDGLMVARGDLGVEMDFEKVPLVQKQIIRLANLRDVPVITATQMLESMTENERPTRAEASDVANAILDGTDAVMLSGETAVGKYPVQAVAAMATIAHETEEHLLAGGAYASPSRELAASSLHDALALAAERIARSLEVKAVVLGTISGQTARYIASSRPRVPVMALSAHPRAVGRMALYWGIAPYASKPWKDTASFLKLAEHAVQGYELAGRGDTIVVVVGREHSEEFSGRIHVHRIGGK
ncbi:MAG: pyruvate kinase [Planctomycetes bacterium]|nr:pyruvate kinase [Planctomycetota bacterium]